jgi:hypothetical protein
LHFKHLFSLHVSTLLSAGSVHSQTALLKGLHHQRRHFSKKSRRKSRVQRVFKCEGDIQCDKSGSGVRRMAIHGYGVPDITMEW